MSSPFEKYTMKRKSRYQKRKGKTKVKFSPPSTFESVMARPFEKWNSVDIVLAQSFPEWGHTQRSVIICNLVYFLELKVIMEEYSENQLLSPTQLVAQAWHALILEARLHEEVTHDIQDFHERPHRQLHHSSRETTEHPAYRERLARTQHLFQTYYQQHMPSCLDDIELDYSETDTSALTEVVGLWFLPGASCSAVDAPEMRNIPQQIEPNVIETKVEQARTILSWFTNSQTYCFDFIHEALCCSDDESSVEEVFILDPEKQDRESDRFALVARKAMLTDSDSLTEEETIPGLVRC